MSGEPEYPAQGIEGATRALCSGHPTQRLGVTYRRGHAASGTA